METLYILNLSNQVLNHISIFKDGENTTYDTLKVRVFEGPTSQYAIKFPYEATSTYEIRFNDEAFEFEFDLKKNSNTVVILSAHKSRVLSQGKKCYAFDNQGIYQKFKWPRVKSSEKVIYLGIESELNPEDKWSVRNYLITLWNTETELLISIAIILILVFVLYICLGIIR
jgi:hypothetical protein